MKSRNIVFLTGHLGNDPQIKTFDNGVKVASLSLATSKQWKDDKGEKHERTEWHNLQIWRGLAEVAEKYCKKGDPVEIIGEIRYRFYEDKEGNKRQATDIVVSDLNMLGTVKRESNFPPPPTDENIPYNDDLEKVPY